MSFRGLWHIFIALLCTAPSFGKERTFSLSLMHHSPVPVSSNPAHFTECGGSVFFTAERTGEDLIWRSAGTAESTEQMVAIPRPEFSPSFRRISSLHCFENVLYYVWRGDMLELHRLHPVRNEPERLSTLPHEIERLERVGTRILLLPDYRVYPYSYGTTLYALDQQWSLHTLEAEGEIRSAAGLGDRVAFFSRDYVWVTDLTQRNTRAIWSPKGVAGFGDLSRLGEDHLVWSSGEDVYVSDGTWSGTRLIHTGVYWWSSGRIYPSGDTIFMLGNGNVWSWSLSDQTVRLRSTADVILPEKEDVPLWRGGLVYVVRDTAFPLTRVNVFWLDEGSANFQIGSVMSSGAPRIYPSPGPLFLRKGGDYWRLDDLAAELLHFDQLSTGCGSSALGTVAGLYQSCYTPDVGEEPRLLSDVSRDALLLANIAPEAPSGAVYGTVSVNGVPASEGSVELYGDDGKFRHRVDVDATGEWRFENVLPGFYRAKAWSREPAGITGVWPDISCPVVSCSVMLGGTFEVVAGMEGGPVDFDLVPGAQIKAHLMDGTEVVPSQPLYVQSGAGDYFDGALTGADGSYRSRGLPLGTYYLIHDGWDIYTKQVYDGVFCSTSGCDLETGTALTLTEGQVAEVNVQGLHRASTRFTGSVVDAETGAPLATGIEIDSEVGYHRLTTTSDENGIWTSPGLIPGAYRVSVSGFYHRGYQYGHGPCESSYCSGDETIATVTATGGEVTNLGEARLALSRYRIRGTVTDAESGEPLAGVRVFAGAWTDTDESGRYEVLTSLTEVIPYVPTPSVIHYGQVYGGDPCKDYCDQSTGIPLALEMGVTAVADLQLERKPFATIHGRVVDTSSQPLEGVVVSYRFSGGTTVTAADGTYSLETRDLQYLGLLQMKLDGYVEPYIQMGPLEAGEAYEVNRELVRKGSFEARIYDEFNGELIENVGYQILNESGAPIWGGAVGAAVSIPPGNYTALFLWNRYQPEAYQDVPCSGAPCSGATYVTVPEGGSVTIRMNVMPKLWRLEGRVIDTDTGEGIAGARIFFNGSFTYGVGTMTLATDTEGFYSLQPRSPITDVFNPFAYAYGYGPLDSAGHECVDQECTNAVEVTFVPPYTYRIDYALRKYDVTGALPEIAHFAGGTIMTVYGRNLPASAEIVIDGEVLPVVSRSSSEISVRTVAGTDGWKDVTLRTIWGQMVLPHAIRYTRPLSGDFNRDVKGDFLWRNNVTGSNAVWFMDGSARLGAAALPSEVVKWTLAGAGDFNGDGRDDLVWRHREKGKNAIWYMNGTKRIGVQSLDAVEDPAWEIASVADFDGDGNADLLWYNTTTGKLVFWYLNGATRSSIVPFDKVADTSWRPMGTSDFSGDGKPDLVWRHMGNGNNAIWFIDSGVRTVIHKIDKVGDLSYGLAAVGDFDGDGDGDFVWRHSSGRNYLWIMNGLTRTSVEQTLKVVDMSWEIAAPK